ncbi:type VI secretion system-associated protein TagF [Muricoccus radiodurans]|uniref:type VI secretion system-associated protein TagF n=1 Tax=Muricoccus radiodurans TaxID=2231721 RepID=UPI003CED56C9
MSGALDASVAGVFGKLPAHGDFVRRGLPARFVEPWDAWLSAGLVAAAEALGEDAWRDAWDTALPFRFRLAPGACGREAAIGVAFPSTDMVGRRFPLTLAALLPNAGDPPPDWFAVAEEAGARAVAGALDADALAALLPLPSDPGDPDATLDGACRFWRTEDRTLLVSAGLPPPWRFPLLLGLEPG